MEIDWVDYQESNSFSKIILDYLNQHQPLQPFYSLFSEISNFELQIQNKSATFSTEKRQILFNELTYQNQHIELTELSKKNISAIKNNSTFTVTTGHQLCLFTGPLYFLYKIISTINTAEQLAKQYHEYTFVPVFWLASEDHDFDEVNHFYFQNQKIEWNSKQRGAVGGFSFENIQETFFEMEAFFGSSNQANELLQLFKKAYFEHENLSKATRFLVNELFGKYGIVCIDGNSEQLKKLFQPIIKNEILNKKSFEIVSKTNAVLSNDYKIQVKPREINFFYLENEVRERIVFENNIYKVLNINLQFTESEICDKINSNPEKFSPNVILRPLYQEYILPNLAYIGGGGELAYWFQLKSVFNYYQVDFPILMLRNSVLIANQKQNKIRQKLQLNWEELFQNKQQLIKQFVLKNSTFDLNFSKLKQHLESQFESLNSMAQQTDISFLKAVNAQKTKQIKGLSNLEKKLIKAQKKKLEMQIQQLENLKNQLFPNDSLQERKINFSEIYIHYTSDFIQTLKENLHPFSQKITIISL